MLFSTLTDKFKHYSSVGVSDRIALNVSVTVGGALNRCLFSASSSTSISSADVFCRFLFIARK